MAREYERVSAYCMPVELPGPVKEAQRARRVICFSMPYEGIHTRRGCYREDDTVEEGKVCVVSAPSRNMVEERYIVLFEWQK